MKSGFKGMESLVVRQEGTTTNRSPKGNMWSAIPVALLCMIVNLSEGKQGSGLKRGRSPVEQTSTFVCPSIRLS